MGYRIRVFTESSGYESVVLIDDYGFPIYWPTLYTSSVLRSKQLQWTTIKKHIEAIKILLIWADFREKNLEQFVRSGEKFLMSELDQIATLCHKSFDVNSDLKKDLKVTVLSSRRSNSEKDLWKRLESSPKQVSSETFNSRLRHIAEYIIWMGDYFSDHPLTGISKDKITSNTSDAARLLLKKKIRTPNRWFEEVKSLSFTELKTIMSVIDPTSSQNPFENMASKVRNYLIVAIMIESGIRSGELLTLTMDMVIRSKNGRNGLQIRRMQGVKKDSRKIKRGTKGRERDVPISQATAELLDLYVKKYRGQIDLNSDLNWLFLSHSNQNRGKPLSRLDGITSKIELVTGIKISPHTFRHTAAWQFCLNCKKAGESWVEVEPKLVYQFGWASSDSPEVIHYAKQYIKDELFSKSIEQQILIANFVSAALEGR